MKTFIVTEIFGNLTQYEIEAETEEEARKSYVEFGKIIKAQVDAREIILNVQEKNQSKEDNPNEELRKWMKGSRFVK